jgi:hypothetical protein
MRAVIKVIAGIVLIGWAFLTGIGTRESNRAAIFQGPIGTFVCLAVILIGAALVIWGIV